MVAGQTAPPRDVLTPERAVAGLFYASVLTVSFDIFLVIPAGFNFRISQLLLAIPILFAVGRAAVSGLIAWPAGFHFLLAWTGFIILFAPAGGLPERGIGYAFWLAFSVLAVYCTTSLFGTPSRIRQVVRWYLFSIAAVAAFGLLQFTLPLAGVTPPLVQQWWIPGTLARINGFSYEPSYFATYLLPGWVLCSRLLEQREYSYAGRRALVAVLLLATAALVLSSSRMGWAMMALWCLRHPARFAVRFLAGRWNAQSARLTLLLACGAGAAIFAFAAVGPWHRDLLLSGTGLFGASAHSAAGRFGEFRDTLAAFARSPLVGYSLGGVSAAVGQVRGVTVATLDDAKMNEGMSVFAEVLAASGAIGFVPFALYVAVLILRPFRAARTTPDPSLRTLLRGLGPALVFELAILQFNQNILRPYLWLQIGILSAACRAASRTAAPPVGSA